MKIKRLNLERWMKFDKEERIKINSITTFKDGWYCIGNRSFFIVDGVHYVGDVNSFKHKLKLLNHNPLRQHEVVAIDTLHAANLLNSEMKSLLYLDKHWNELRNIYRSSRLFMLKNMRFD
jgi:hypothetical protein